MKNKLPQHIIDKIPKGKSKNDKNIRKKYIVEYLSKYIGKSLRNEHLKNNLKFTKYSLDEICWWASQSYESTLVALNLKELIENAKCLSFAPPKQGNQSKKFGAWVTIILYSKFENKVIKITICDSIKKNTENGKYDFIIYCITAKNALQT